MKQYGLPFAIVVPLIGVAPVLGDTCTFTESSGSWSTVAFWDCGAGGSHVPTLNDKAIIDTGNTCNVTADAECDTLEVKSTGVLNIQSGNKLEMDSTDASSATIDGTVNLEGSGSELAVIDTHLVLTGSGSIVGKDDNAKISVMDGQLVTCDTDFDIEGQLKITGLGTFFLKGNLHANRAGTLLVETGIADVAGARWKISTSSSAVLQLNFPGSSQTLLQGSFPITLGTLDVDNEGFRTDGWMSIANGTIDVGSGAVAAFDEDLVP
ncbi:MAG: hypothetical protein IID37_09560 [Planctomycetes bacterium]|nr:hypothetical protein [Planctomycetota bacterium]